MLLITSGCQEESFLQYPPLADAWSSPGDGVEGEGDCEDKGAFTMEGKGREEERDDAKSSMVSKDESISSQLSRGGLDNMVQDGDKKRAVKRASENKLHNVKLIILLL